ncbi:MAG: transglycosylase domain-containing protein [Actinomycetota bacterium]
MDLFFRVWNKHPWLVASAAATVVLLPLAALGAFIAFWTITRPADTIPQPKPVTEAHTSHIYAADGSLLAKFHGEVDRVPVDLKQMPKHLQDAVLAAEDARFFKHSGVDTKAIIRALLADFFAGEPVQGGSTITQQYVKTAYISRRRTLVRKVREARLAQKLENELSKKEILERYLNTVYFGEGAYGVEAAAQRYFGKSASELTLSESALIAGIIPAPTRFAPTKDPGAAEIRRLFVLDRMERLQFVTPAAAEAARTNRPSVFDARAREEVFRFPWFVDAVRRYLLHRYGEGKVFGRGLEVTTTIDVRMQADAEKILAETLSDRFDPHAALVAVEPKTGYVRAVVGGREYGKEKFNIAIQGRRQPGSAFKPFVLTAALENDIPVDKRYRGPATICIKGWRPTCEVQNFDKSSFGSLDLEQATIHSVNTIFAQLVMDVGPDKVVDTAKRMGIPGPEWLPTRSGCKRTDADPCRTRIDPLPALALGAEEVTTLEMASAFATLAREGVYREPKVVSRVTDSKGKVLESGPADTTQALDPGIAQRVTSILEGVIREGTGTRANIDRPAAGKTGTAQDFHNAWFVGYTPDLSTAVWMGYKDANRPMENIQGVPRVAGGTIPAEMWSAFMRLALDGTDPVGFTPPPLPAPPEAAPGAGSPSPTETAAESTLPTPTPSYSPLPLPTPSPTATQRGQGYLCGLLLPCPAQSPTPSPPPTPYTYEYTPPPDYPASQESPTPPPST